jgi:heat shock protein HslJ
VAIGLDAGCNRIGGTATLVPAGAGRSVLRVDDLMSTEMACAPAVMAQEDLYSRLLRGRPTVSLDGSRLVIEGTPVPADAAAPRSGALRVTMTDRRAQSPDQTLVGPRWQVDGLVSGAGPDASVSSVPAGVTAWLQIDRAGRMTLSAGCNTGNGSVTVSGGPGSGSMVIGPVATTRKACPPPASDVERHVLGVLQGTVAWTVSGSTLAVDGAESGLRLRVG